MWPDDLYMPTTAKRRPAAKAQPVSDTHLARIAWQSAGLGALTYAVAIDARATTWPLAQALASGIAAAVGGVL